MPSPPTPRGRLRAATDAESLLDAARACGLGELLDGPSALVCEAIPYDAHAAAPLLHQLVDEGRADCVSDLLATPDFRRRWRRRARAAGDAWLLETLRAFFESELAAQHLHNDARTETLAPESPPARVREWARSQGVDDLLRLPAALLLPRLGSRAARWMAREPLDTTLIDLFAAPTAGSAGRSAWGPSVPFSVKLAATDLLVEESENSVVTTIPDTAPPEGLQALAGRLAEAHAALSAHTASRAPAELDQLCAALHPTEDHFTLAAPAGALPCRPDGRPEVSLKLDSDAISSDATCTCGGDASRCRWTLRAVDSLQVAVHGPSNPLQKELLHRAQVPRWTRQLDSLATLLSGGEAPPAKGAQPAWRVSVDARGRLELAHVWARPFQRKSGWRTWPGRPPADHPADHAALDQLQLQADSVALRTAVVARALEALVGHPRVLLSMDGAAAEPVEVRSATLGLALGPGDSPDTIALTPAIDGRPWPAEQVLRELVDQCAGDRTAWLDGALHVARLSEPARRVLRLVLDRGARYPADALGTLVDRLPAFEQALPVTILDSLLGPAVPPSPRWQLGLSWSSRSDGAEQLRVRLRVSPLPHARPRRPGLGPSRALGRQGDAPVHAWRDRADERTTALALLDALGLDPPPPGKDARWDWLLSVPTPALPLLQRLQNRLQDGLPIDEIGWDGPKPGLTRATAADLQVQVHASQRRGWFRLDGSLDVDTLELELSELLDQVRRGRRFVRVAPGRWAELGDDLQARLSALASMSRPQQSGAQLPGYCSDAVQQLAEAGGQLTTDAAWQRLRDRVDAAHAEQVCVPPGLRCTLRPYQQRGFAWLVRLTSWGAGGVLADDMGLGKTVQALALLLHRARHGPALVVAPSSLAFNWRDEAGRFAPGLKVHTYRGPARARILDGLGPGDLVLSTYDIVARDAEQLGALRFATLVLDEAHAIKNSSTRRARAVHALAADARVALTGTPIENRLDELRSLFEAVCPGLLGSSAEFREEFVAPIEGDGDDERREALSRLVRPFLLRRLKREVAPELPVRTMQVHRVQARSDHAGHYARERDRAVAETRQLLAIDADSPGSRMRILAWLTRLRMLACHPVLVDPGWPGGSAKLDHALGLVRELTDTGHAVLVFSQFTRHLDLVEQALAAEGRPSCRIDGQTSPSSRESAVTRFQAGQAKVFLLSLKAGGVGLNLTAADHVLLLDPWWNPAAEDQAADRAHRIGQHRPVTVTRLVTAGTIEDDILALQDDKRALVAGILDGASTAGRLDPQELARLIHGSDALRRDLRDDDIPF